MGDSVVLSTLGSGASFAGRGLDVAASADPLGTAQSVAAFTLRAR